MLYLIFQDGIAYFFRILFVKKLGRVAAHEHYRILLMELLLKILHIRQHMKTIDAAVGPKVNEH